MISSNANLYCCEDISKIENYDEAAKDLSQIWHVHHIKGEEFTAAKLIKNNLYYNRPANELIFLKPSSHNHVHRGYGKGVNNWPSGDELSYERKQEITKINKKYREQLNEWVKQVRN